MCLPLPRRMWCKRRLWISQSMARSWMLWACLVHLVQRSTFTWAARTVIGRLRWIAFAEILSCCQMRSRRGSRWKMTTGSTCILPRCYMTGCTSKLVFLLCLTLCTTQMAPWTQTTLMHCVWQLTLGLLMCDLAATTQTLGNSKTTRQSLQHTLTGTTRPLMIVISTWM